MKRDTGEGLPPPLFHAAVAATQELLTFQHPADGVLSAFFRKHRSGGRDRALIAEAGYAGLRRLRSLQRMTAALAPPRRLPLQVALAITRLLGVSLRQLEPALAPADHEWLRQQAGVPLDADDAAPLGERLDLPDWLAAQLAAEFPAGELPALARMLNSPAPLDLRVNILKADRAAVLARLRDEGLRAEPTPLSPVGIRVAGRPALHKHPLFLDGTLEVQDEGSQLLGLLVQPRRGEMVVDYCAGAGGKTLQLGAMMRSTGRLYAFDVAEQRLARLRPRAARAGLSNVHPVCISGGSDARVKRLSGKADRVLVDAPCSGLGTLRRNPDLKWRQTPDSVAELTTRQTEILAAAARLVRPGGRLVYATCSLLAAENDAVLDAFLAAHPAFRPLPAAEILAGQGIALDTGDRLRLLPHRHGTDGFFAAVMERAK